MHRGSGVGDMRVAAEVVVGERVVPAQLAVVAAEPVAPVVPHEALLSPPRRRLDRAGVRLDAKIAVAQVQCLAGEVTLDLTAEEATRAVHPAVEAILQTVHAPLVVFSAETAVQLLHHVSPAVAVG